MFEAKVYLSLVVINNLGQCLLTENGLFPSIEVPQITQDLHAHSPDFIWFVRKANDWRTPSPPASFTATSTPFDEHSLTGSFLRDELRPENEANPGLSPLRLAMLKSVTQLASNLSLTSLGMVHEEPIYMVHNHSYFIVAVQVLPNKGLGFGGDWVRNGFLKWKAQEQVNFESYQPVSHVWRSLCDPATTAKPEPTPLSQGLYLAFFSVTNRKTGMFLLTLKGERSMIPYIKIRGHHQLSERERAWLVKESDLSKSTYASLNQNSLTMLCTPKTEPAPLFQSPISAPELTPESQDSAAEPLRPHEDLRTFQDALNLAKQYLASLTSFNLDAGKVIIEAPFYLGERQDVQIICITEPFQALEKRLSAAMIVNRNRSRSIGDQQRDRVENLAAEAAAFGGPVVDYSLPEVKVSPFPLSLFEALHQHMYCRGQYTTFRRKMEELEVAMAKRNVEIALEKKNAQKSGLRSRRSRQQGLDELAENGVDDDDDDDGNDGWGPRERVDEKLRALENQVNFHGFTFGSSLF